MWVVVRWRSCHGAGAGFLDPLGRLNGDVKRRSDVVGIFPNDRAVVRLVDALMLEQNDEWAIGRRYMGLESFAPVSDTPIAGCGSLISLGSKRGSAILHGHCLNAFDKRGQESAQHGRAGMPPTARS